MDGDFPGARRDLAGRGQKTDENFVLNNVRLGSAALAEYDLDRPSQHSCARTKCINSVNVNDGGRSLGAAVVSENIKVWKGEPFERAMANFYLGLVYYMRHDYQNARAAFENALFKLRDYGEAMTSPTNTATSRATSRSATSCWPGAGSGWATRTRQEEFRPAAELQPYLAPLANPR